MKNNNSTLLIDDYMDNKFNIELFEQRLDVVDEDGNTLLMVLLKDNKIHHTILQKVLGDNSYNEIIEEVNERLKNSDKKQFNSKNALELNFSSLGFWTANEEFKKEIQKINNYCEDLAQGLVKKSSFPEEMLQNKNCWNYVMIYACEENKLELIQQLLDQEEKSKKPNPSVEKIEEFFKKMLIENQENSILINESFLRAKKPFEKSQEVLDIKGQDGAKLFRIAYSRGYVDQVKYWMDKGVDVNFKTIGGSPLENVAANNNICETAKSQIIEILLKTPGIKVNYDVLKSFAKCEDTIITKEVEEAFLSAPIGQTQLQGDFVFGSIFHHSNNFKIFELFIKKGAPITKNILELEKDRELLTVVKDYHEILNDTHQDFYQFSELLVIAKKNELLWELLKPRLVEKLATSLQKNDLKVYKEKVSNMLYNSEFKDLVDSLFKDYEITLLENDHQKIFIEAKQEEEVLVIIKNEDSSIFGDIIDTDNTDNN
jgi:hypothetical protein